MPAKVPVPMAAYINRYERNYNRLPSEYLMDLHGERIKEQVSEIINLLRLPQLSFIFKIIKEGLPIHNSPEHSVLLSPLPIAPSKKRKQSSPLTHTSASSSTLNPTCSSTKPLKSRINLFQSQRLQLTSESQASLLAKEILQELRDMSSYQLELQEEYSMVLDILAKGD